MATSTDVTFDQRSHAIQAARGFVLGSVDSAGVVNLDASMSDKQFVAHLREALVNAGLTREMADVYSAHSMRAGGAPLRQSMACIERTSSTWRA